MAEPKSYPEIANDSSDPIPVCVVEGSENSILGPSNHKFETLLDSLPTLLQKEAINWDNDVQEKACTRFLSSKYNLDSPKTGLALILWGARENERLTTIEAARLLGMSQSYVSRIEYGLRIPSTKSIHSLSEKYHLDFGSLRELQMEAIAESALDGVNKAEAFENEGKEDLSQNLLIAKAMPVLRRLSEQPLYWNLALNLLHEVRATMEKDSEKYPQAAIYNLSP